MKIFEDLSISTIIWANLMMRASIAHMSNVAKKIQKEDSIENVSNEVVSIQEIFRLQNIDELKEAEKKYLPAMVSRNQ